MVGNERSGRKKETKGNAAPYKATSLSGRQFSSLITNKPPNMPEIKTNPIEETQAQIKISINQRIENWGLIRKAEATQMPKEIIDEMKIQMGLSKDEEKNDQNMDSKDMMIMQMIQQEEDPHMKQILLMSLMNKGSKGIDPMMMSMVMNNGSKKKDSPEFMEKLAMKFIEGKTDNTSDIDKAMEFHKKMQEMNETMKPKDVLDEMMKSKERLIELGIVQDPQGGIEDRKMDLEFKKLELDHERVVAEQESKTGGQEEIMKAVTGGIQALLGAVGHHMGNKNQQEQGPSPEEQRNSQIKNSNTRIMGKCSNPECNLEFPVVTDKDRTINCPNPKCDFTYIVEKGDFYISKESEAKLNSSSSDEPKEEIKLEK